jgi:hypothetical protein
MTMTETPMQEQFFKTMRRGQEFLLGAVKTTVGVVEPYAPKRGVHMPLTDRLPRPRVMVESTYDFAEKLLANQHKFAVEVLDAAAPLAPAAKSTAHATKTRPAAK